MNRPRRVLEIGLAILLGTILGIVLTYASAIRPRQRELGAREGVRSPFFLGLGEQTFQSIAALNAGGAAQVAKLHQESGPRAGDAVRQFVLRCEGEPSSHPKMMDSIYLALEPTLRAQSLQAESQQVATATPGGVGAITALRALYRYRGPYLGEIELLGASCGSELTIWVSVRER